MSRKVTFLVFCFHCMLLYMLFKFTVEIPYLGQLFLVIKNDEHTGTPFAAVNWQSTHGIREAKTQTLSLWKWIYRGAFHSAAKQKHNRIHMEHNTSKNSQQMFTFLYTWETANRIAKILYKNTSEQHLDHTNLLDHF